MKKTVLQALLFAVLVIIIYYAVQIGIGMYLTMTYVPDIAGHYSSVDYLQRKVSFGVIYSGFSVAVELVLLIAAAMALFIGGKLLLNKIRK